MNELDEQGKIIVYRIVDSFISLLTIVSIAWFLTWAIFALSPKLFHPMEIHLNPTFVQAILPGWTPD